MNHQSQYPVRRSTGSLDKPAAWAQGLTHWLIHRAALAAPAPLSERMEEEWLADLTSRPSPGSRLRFALGCCWATRVISLERRAASAALATPAAHGKLAIPYPYGDIGIFSRHSSTLVVVATLHLAVFYGLVTGLRSGGVPWVPPPLIPQWLPQAPHTPPPSLPKPAKETVRWDPSMPEVPPSYTDDDDKIIVAPTPGNPMEDTNPRHAVNRVSGGPGAGFPDAEDYYPAAARRLEEQGISTVRVCVDAHGRLTSAPTTVQGSGSARLDEGALRLAQAGSGHYRASMEDGRAIDSCYAFRIRFTLKN
jgi:TonB family protein